MNADLHGTADPRSTVHGRAQEPDREPELADAAARWSAASDGWAEHWGGFAAPVWDVLVALTGVGPGSRAVDVGCGAGELLAHLADLGVDVSGADPAPGMLAIARSRLPDADLRTGSADDLPWSTGATGPTDEAGFDLATLVNSLQFADDRRSALQAVARLVRPGGHLAVASWAEAARNDLDTVEHALAEADGEERPDDPDYRLPGGLESIFVDAGLDVVATGLVDVPWNAVDDEALVAGVLFGEDPERVAESRPVVLAAAAPFRAADGSYLLRNAFRYAIARV